MDTNSQIKVAPPRLSVAGILLWATVLAVLATVVASYAAYALAAILYPYGLDYSEGLLWQQALWTPGPHMYGDIFRYPFVVFEYPPLYLLAMKAVAGLGVGMLPAGRAISVASTLAACTLLGLTVWRACRGSADRRHALLASVVAGLLPLTLLPVLSWSVLVRVDMMALALSWAGVLLAIMAFRRPGLLFPAVFLFVAAVFTKQIFLAAPVCLGVVWLIRSPRLAVGAYALGGLAGLAGLGALAWVTHGGFVRHIFLYTADRVDLARAWALTSSWLLAYPVLALLALAALAASWLRLRAGHGVRGLRDLAAAIRGDERAAFTVFLSLYLLATSCMLVAAGKTGSSRNYFIEWMCCWCAWIGVLVAAPRTSSLTSQRFGRIAPLLIPACLLLQIWPLPGALGQLRRDQFSAAHASASAALLARARGLHGPILSDDMVMLLQSGHEVPLDQCVLLELSQVGMWREQLLVDLLTQGFFAAVVTAYGPGDPTFNGRYLPATQAAMLQSYPRVEDFGDYRLRLPP